MLQSEGLRLEMVDKGQTNPSSFTLATREYLSKSVGKILPLSHFNQNRRSSRVKPSIMRGDVICLNVESEPLYHGSQEAVKWNTWIQRRSPWHELGMPWGHWAGDPWWRQTT